MSVIAIGKSDVGCVRRSNEDSIGLFPQLGVYIVADGMGGHAAGEVASQLAVEQISRHFERSVVSLTRPGLPQGERRLCQAIVHANRHIFEASSNNPALDGMGTTVVALSATPEEVSIAFVGDSRVYLHQNQSIQQLTHDHSLVNQYVEKGIIPPEAAETHPQKHVLSRALGTSAEVKVETFTRIPQHGDIYLLCSDGLSNKLSAAELNALIMEADGRLDTIGENMVLNAKEKGGEDNISLILVAYPTN